MDRNGMPRLAIVLTLALLLPSACGTSSAQPTPVPPTAAPASIPGVAAPLTIDGIDILITEVREGQFFGTSVVKTKEEMGMLGGYEAKEGSRFVEVAAQVAPGTSVEQVSDWKVVLNDTQGDQYQVEVNSSGAFVGGDANVAWVFVVPNGVTDLKLSFPGGELVDLSSLIGKQ